MRSESDFAQELVFCLETSKLPFSSLHLIEIMIFGLTINVLLANQLVFLSRKRNEPLLLFLLRFDLVMDEDGADSSDQINQFIRLEKWLRSRMGPEIPITLVRCRRTQRPFLDVAAAPKEMTFLATFHLIFTLATDSTVQMHLVAFNGKIVDSSTFELVSKAAC